MKSSITDTDQLICAERLRLAAPCAACPIRTFFFFVLSRKCFYTLIKGSLPNPVLFNLAMARVAWQLEQDTPARFVIRSDDVTIWTEAPDSSSLKDMLTELQTAILSLETNCHHIGFKMAPSKNKLLSAH